MISKYSNLTISSGCLTNRFWGIIGDIVNQNKLVYTLKTVAYIIIDWFSDKIRSEIIVQP